MSSRHTSGKSTTNAAPPPPCQIHPTATVADKAQLTGTHAIEIGEGAVIHPHACLRSDYGRVIIGAYTSVAEKAVIGNGTLCPGQDHTVAIGDNVAIESGAIVEAAQVGSNSVIDVRAILGRGVKIGQWCNVAARETVHEGTEIEDFTVVFGDGQRRLDRTIQEHKEIRVAKQMVHERTLEAVRGVVADAASKWTDE